MPEGKVTAPEAAKLLGVTRQRVIAMIKKWQLKPGSRGALKAERFGPVWMIDVLDVEKIKGGGRN